MLVVKEFEDIPRRQGRIEMLLKWIGFKNGEADGVDIESLIHDVPDLLEEYLEEIKKEGIRRQWNATAIDRIDHK